MSVSTAPSPVTTPVDSENTIIETRSLSKVYRDFWGRKKVQALKPLDIDVRKGEIFGLLGPNGSGKTTTIRMILRIYQPDEGKVAVLGKTEGSVADARVGYLPEERGLYRRMTVRRVLRYFARLKGVSRPDRVIDEHLERMGAQDWGRKRIEQLSKGMAQKIQFIVAVIAKPELIILDEPFSGLDPVNMEVLRDAVLELRRQGSTVIFSTHDMDMAERMCDRVFMIYRGKKVLDGTLESIQSGYGTNTLRVRMANHQSLPDRLDGVARQTITGRFYDLELDGEESRPRVLSQLLQIGDVEHFETTRPSLHDIFVKIAKI